ncbi:MAG: zinc metalloprotease HtpX [Negativicutes bacterium]|nr:zinc metalloprotease HtpX [Negativicutes bacterium]
MNRVKTAVLLGLLTVLMILLGNAFGGAQGMTVMLVFSLLMNFVSYWYSDKIVLRMYGAQPIEPGENPQLYNLVVELARAGQIPVPRIYIIDEPAPNAFATGRDPEHGVVAVTTGILQALSRDELRGVIAHELAHIKNRDTLISTIAATLAGVITYIANMAQWMMIFGGRSSDEREEGGGMLGALLMMIVAPLAAMIIQLAISRTREYQADATGAGICGQPLALASALEKIQYYARHRTMPEATPATSALFIINPLRGGGIVSLFSTHPPTEERIARLREMARRKTA